MRSEVVLFKGAAAFSQTEWSKAGKEYSEIGKAVPATLSKEVFLLLMIMRLTLRLQKGKVDHQRRLPVKKMLNVRVGERNC